MHIFDMPIQVALVIGSISAIRTTKRFFPSVDSNMDFQIFPTFHNGRTEWAHITVLTKSYWSVLERTKEIYLWEICSFLNHCFFLSTFTKYSISYFHFHEFPSSNSNTIAASTNENWNFLGKKAKNRMEKRKIQFFFLLRSRSSCISFPF